MAVAIQPGAHDGLELYYHGHRTLETRLAHEGKMMAVPVKSAGEFQAGVPVPLFDFALRNANANFAVSRDGRFLIPVFRKPEAPPITVILNWTGLLSPLTSSAR